MPINNPFLFTDLFNDYIATGSFRAARKNRYNCILGLINSNDDLRNTINAAVFDNINKQSTRADFESAINQAQEEYSAHLKELTKLNQFPEIESAYITEIKREFTKNV
ncbi:hypothetical protein TMEC54S_03227 [Thauera mechernichensis]